MPFTLKRTPREVTNIFHLFRWVMEDAFLHGSTSDALDCGLAAATQWICNPGVQSFQDLVASTGIWEAAEAHDSKINPSKSLGLHHWMLWRAISRQYDRDVSVAKK